MKGGEGKMYIIEKYIDLISNKVSTIIKTYRYNEVKKIVDTYNSMIYEYNQYSDEMKNISQDDEKLFCEKKAQLLIKEIDIMDYQRKLLKKYEYILSKKTGKVYDEFWYKVDLKKEKMDPKVGLIISDIYNIKNMLPIERDLRSIYEI